MSRKQKERQSMTDRALKMENARKRVIHRDESDVGKPQHITINYRVSKTKAKTHPVQIMVSINRRFKTLGYKKVIQNLYMTTPLEGWDNKRKQFKDDPERNIILSVLGQRLKRIIRQYLGHFGNPKVFPDELFDQIKSGIQERILTQLEQTKSEAKALLQKEDYKQRGILTQDQQGRFQEMTFHDYVEFLIQYWKATSVHVAQTTKRYNTLLNKITEWNPKIKVKDLNDFVIDDFIMYIKDNYEIKLKYFGSLKGVIKKIINYAQKEHKILLDLNSQRDILKKQSEPRPDVYFSVEMLKKMYDFEFSRPSYRRVVDQIIIASYLGGVRRSDWEKIKYVQTEVDEKGFTYHFVELTDQKTGNRGSIPVFNFIYSLLQKYKFEIKPISAQKFNIFLKEAIKEMFLAGHQEFGRVINRSYRNIKSDSKKIIEHYVPFYELVKSSSGRRSFCSNFHYHYKYPITDIMVFSHHATMGSFLEYLEENIEDKKKDIVRLSKEVNW